jgi:hypothetical protein
MLHAFQIFLILFCVLPLSGQKLTELYNSSQSADALLEWDLIRTDKKLNLRFYRDWRQAIISSNETEQIFEPINKNREPWTEWTSLGRKRISIVAVGNDRYKTNRWEIFEEGQSHIYWTVEQKNPNHSKPWSEWFIELPIEKGKYISMSTKYITGDIKQSWEIDDPFPNADPEMKNAALFIALFGTLFPYLAPKEACTCNGHLLQGKVKFVTSGEDIKIKYVPYYADIKVQMLTLTPQKCGEWQEVTSGENLRVKVVNSGEDLKVEKVSLNPGMK